MNLFFLAVGFCWDSGLVGTRELRDVEHGGRGESRMGSQQGCGKGPVKFAISSVALLFSVMGAG